MPNFKTAFLFRQTAQGWSENWYVTADGIRAAIDLMFSLVLPRSELLGKGGDIQAVRAAEIGNPRHAMTKRTRGSLTTQGDFPDYPSASIVVQCRAKNRKYRRVMTLRGCPDNWVYEDVDKKRIVVHSACAAALVRWAGFAKDAGLKFRSPSKEGVIASGQPIQSFVRLGTRIAVTCVDLGAEVGEKITIKKVMGNTKVDRQRINRTFKVAEKTGDTYTLDAPAPLVTDLTAFYGGKGFRKTAFYPIVDECIVVRPGRRKVGRAFFVPAGRRKRRR